MQVSVQVAFRDLPCKAGVEQAGIFGVSTAKSGPFAMCAIRLWPSSAGAEIGEFQIQIPGCVGLDQVLAGTLATHARF